MEDTNKKKLSRKINLNSRLLGTGFVFSIVAGGLLTTPTNVLADTPTEVTTTSTTDSVSNGNQSSADTTKPTTTEESKPKDTSSSSTDNTSSSTDNTSSSSADNTSSNSSDNTSSSVDNTSSTDNATQPTTTEESKPTDSTNSADNTTQPTTTEESKPSDSSSSSDNTTQPTTTEESKPSDSSGSNETVSTPKTEETTTTPKVDETTTPKVDETTTTTPKEDETTTTTPKVDETNTTTPKVDETTTPKVDETTTTTPKEDETTTPKVDETTTTTPKEDDSSSSSSKHTEETTNNEKTDTGVSDNSSATADTSTNSSNGLSSNNSATSTSSQTAMNSSQAASSTNATNSTESTASENSTNSQESKTSENSTNSTESTNNGSSTNSTESKASENSTNSTESKASENSTNSTESKASENSTNSTESTANGTSTNASTSSESSNSSMTPEESGDISFNYGGTSTSVKTVKNPVKIDINDIAEFTTSATGTSKVSDVTYTQLTSNGITIDLKDNQLIPVNSKVVATYKDSEGNVKNVTVAEITSSKEYALGVHYSDANKSVGFTLNKEQLLPSDISGASYVVNIDGKDYVSVNVGDDNSGGTASLLSSLDEGTHVISVSGTSKYGIQITGTTKVLIEKKVTPTVPDNTNNTDTNKDKTTDTTDKTDKKDETPVVPTPTPTPTPVPDKKEEVVVPNKKDDVVPSKKDEVVVPDNRDTTPLTPTTPVTPVTPTTPTTPDSNGSSTVVKPDTVTPRPSTNTDVLPTPQPNNNDDKNRPQVEDSKPIVREAPKGVNDVQIGGNSIYNTAPGEAPKGVATNGETTTFTDSRKVDVKVKLDTNVVDTSKTVIKLKGRNQGELDAGSFVELKNGTYRLKDIAKDDFYTLSIKAYDKEGKLVTDTNETFSINKMGSKFRIANTNLQGESVKSLDKNLDITETNVDKIKTDKTVFKIYRDGKLVEIPRKAIKVSKNGGVSSNWKYTYSINKKYFKEDGVYTVDVFSESETGVKYSSTKTTLQFTVDTTGAEIHITGIRDGGRYKSATKRITFDIRDISKLKSIKAWINGKEVKLKYDKSTGLYYYDMASSGKEANQLEVEVIDAAGNVSKQTVKSFYVSSDLSFSIFNDNNIYYLLGGLGTLLAGFVGFVVYRRNKAFKREDDIALEQARLLSESYSGHQSGTTGKHSGKTWDNENNVSFISTKDMGDLAGQRFIAGEDFDKDVVTTGSNTTNFVDKDLENLIGGISQEHSKFESAKKDTDLGDKVDEELLNGEDKVKTTSIEEEVTNEDEILTTNIDEEVTDNEDEVMTTSIDEELLDEEDGVRTTSIEEEVTDEDEILTTNIDEEVSDNEDEVLTTNIDEEVSDNEDEVMTTSIDEELLDGEDEVLTTNIDEEVTDEDEVMTTSIDEEISDDEVFTTAIPEEE